MSFKFNIVRQIKKPRREPGPVSLKDLWAYFTVTNLVLAVWSPATKMAKKVPEPSGANSTLFRPSL